MIKYLEAQIIQLGERSTSRSARRKAIIDRNIQLNAELDEIKDNIERHAPEDNVDRRKLLLNRDHDACATI